MWTVLFDIDGTLVNTRGAGAHALRRAMQAMFEIPELPSVEYAGRTDRAIFADLFRPHEIDEANLPAFSELYWQFLPESLAQKEGQILTGVVEFLEWLSGRDDIGVGIVTGNAKRPAELKLAHFALQSQFRFGGFGDHSACRNEVARNAMDSAKDCLGASFDPEKIWMIGDTVDDISCARAIGSQVIAVETGSNSPEALGSASPDIQLPSLADWEKLTQIFVAKTSAIGMPDSCDIRFSKPPVS